VRARDGEQLCLFSLLFASSCLPLHVCLFGSFLPLRLVRLPFQRPFKACLFTSTPALSLLSLLLLPSPLSAPSSSGTLNRPPCCAKRDASPVFGLNRGHVTYTSWSRHGRLAVTSQTPHRHVTRPDRAASPRGRCPEWYPRPWPCCLPAERG